MKRRARLAMAALAAAVLTLAWLAYTSSVPDESDQLAAVAATIATPWTLDCCRQPRTAPGSGLAALPAATVHPLEPGGEVPQSMDRVRLALPDREPLVLSVRRITRHVNGDRSVVAGDEIGMRSVITFGRNGAVHARIREHGRLYQVTTDATGAWLVDLDGLDIPIDPFEGDTLAAADADRAGSVATPARSDTTVPRTHAHGELARIDVMFIYPDAMQLRYPGELLDTRFNHAVAIANQALVDSGVDAQVRLVHHQRVAYVRHSDNRSTLADLARALDGERVPGLEDLDTKRSREGADLVAMIWPHDIETRGSCGIAYFPQQDQSGRYLPQYGVQISNDGTSNWSVCSDAVFAHELGHNLGARHQRAVTSGAEPNEHNFAWVRAGRWHTLMGSFGTGHDERYRRLDVYSNPDRRCGAEPCGSRIPGDGADNAGHMSGVAPAVSAYAGAAGTADTHPDPSSPDRDGDGTPDREDSYPFDPHDGEPPPADRPALAFAPRRLAEPEDAADWELLVVSSGSDEVLSWGLDGRYRGVVAAPDAVNPGPILTGYSDLDVDAEGRLYLLASEDVRRFDRLSGRLIDVFLDSGLPVPRTLKSSFPRAMAWISDDRLAVLGDEGIELYDQSGLHLNPLRDEAPDDDPPDWRQPMALALRGLAERSGRLFVAEATHNRIMSFISTNGGRTSDVAGPGNGRVSDPRDLVIGPDRMLYLANGAGDNVLRYDPIAREYLGEFVAAGAGGLDFARALAFAPDGNLLVASRASNEILRYDGASGEFIGVFVGAGEHGLDSPEQLAVAPVLDQLTAGHSGSYFVPSRDGEGWLLEILDDERAAISWFTYPPASEPERDQAWAVGVGRVKGARIVFEEMLATRLLDPRAGLEPGNLEILDWGRLELDFSNCRFGRARYDSLLFDERGELDFQRLAAIGRLPCGSAPLQPGPGAPGISGQWSDPAANGQGWFLEELGDGRVFTAWFGYDGDGAQRWMVGDGRLEGRSLVFDPVVTSTGAVFGEGFDPDQVELVPAGLLEFDFIDCDHAHAMFESSLAAFSDLELRPERLTRLQSMACGFD